MLALLTIQGGICKLMFSVTGWQVIFPYWK